MTASNQSQSKSDSYKVEILPLERRKKLQEAGLATFKNSSITYERIPYTDNITDGEEQVRADLYLDLVEKYGYDASNAIEMEKHHKIGHPHKKSDAKIDILVKQATNNKPFMVIELKSPDEYEGYMERSIQTQLFNVAAVENQGHNSIKYLVYHTRFWEDGNLQEKTICIDYVKYSSFEGWDTAGRPNLRTIPKDYGVVRVPQYVKGGENDLRINVRRDELQRIRKDLHNILWGGGKYQNELFFNLVGLFLVKIYDEKETVVGQPYDFQIFFEDGDPESSPDVYKRMNETYFLALKEYLGYTKSQLRKVKDIVFDPQKVRYAVEVLQSISFTANKFDVIGDFFEGIVRGEFKQSKGQYLTHTNLIKFMVEGLQLGELALHLINNEKRLPYIIDPACGSGAFLIESMKKITDYILSNQSKIRKSDAVNEFVRSSFPEFRRNAWAKHFIYGIEINGDLAIATKVNMVGHGDGSANIENKDGLIPFKEFSLGFLQVSKTTKSYPKPVNEQFDAIFSNPPFSVTVDRDSAKTFPANYVQGESILKMLKSNNELEVDTELLFIERYYQLLRPRGRLAVILPESVFDTSSSRDIRLFLFKYFKVLGIISLPTEAFAPYTTTKTNILFAEKKTENEINQWVEAWTRYSEQYKSLKEKINKYVKPPVAYKKLIEVSKLIGTALDVAFDENEEHEFAKAVLNFALTNKNSKELKDEVTQFMVDYIEDTTTELKESLKASITRKTSLFPAINDYIQLVQTNEELAELLRELFGELFDETHTNLSVEDLSNEYREEISYADEDWWVFKHVCMELPSYDTVLSHAEEIGYKRGVRGEDNRPNELFQSIGETIVINITSPQSILDELLANIRWGY